MGSVLLNYIPFACAGVPFAGGGREMVGAEECAGFCATTLHANL